jgi:hypothetical protein
VACHLNMEFCEIVMSCMKILATKDQSFSEVYWERCTLPAEVYFSRNVGFIDIIGGVMLHRS